AGRLFGARTRLAMRPDRRPLSFREFKKRILGVGCIAVVPQREPASKTDDCLRLNVEHPPHDVERVMPQVRHLATGIIPKPAEMINTSLRIVSPQRRWAKKHVPVEFR